MEGLYKDYDDYGWIMLRFWKGCGRFQQGLCKNYGGILKDYVRILRGLCKDSGRSMSEVLPQGWGTAKGAVLLQY